MMDRYFYTASDGRKMAYLDNGASDKKAIVFLHGWGADKYNLGAVFYPLDASYRIISVDLPGFGESDRPSTTWSSAEYAAELYSFFDFLHLGRYALVGHSFGGKVAALLAARYPESVEKIVLIAANCLKNKKNLFWYLQVYSYKFVKSLLLRFHREDIVEKLRKNAGSDDYKNSVGMRDILVKTVNEDLSSLMGQITVPVFLYWGSDDRATPVWMAKKLHMLLSDAGLYVVPRGSHYPFLQDNSIVSIIKSFI